MGILQPITDAVKLSNKQINFLTNFSFFFHYLSSFFLIFGSIIIWTTLFCEPSIISYKFRFLVFFIVLGFNSLNVILAGWRTFSKFSLLGRIRSVAQLVSYEASLYLCLFFFLIMNFRFEFYNLNFLPLNFFLFIVPPVAFIWVPSFLAELNRTPYDFSEGERELVRGFNTEFGSSSFTIIFLAEYGNILFFTLLRCFLFFWSFSYYYFFLIFFFVIWIRSVLPRFRFDKLIDLAWKFYIPFLTFFFIYILIITI